MLQRWGFWEQRWWEGSYRRGPKEVTVTAQHTSGRRWKTGQLVRRPWGGRAAGIVGTVQGSQSGLDERGERGEQAGLWVCQQEQLSLREEEPSKSLDDHWIFQRYSLMFSKIEKMQKTLGSITSRKERQRDKETVYLWGDREDAWEGDTKYVWNIIR